MSIVHDVMNSLVAFASQYRKVATESLVGSTDPNAFTEAVQPVVDVILADYLNFVGTQVGVDMDLKTFHISNTEVQYDVSRAKG